MSFLRQFIKYTNLEGEVDDFNLIHEQICKDIVFKGTNLWILMFAILVASVGLNMNSTAVIIGAMLISPLMGPINGMGYAIATYDFPLFQKAAKNFSFAVFASLIASTTYFAISPVSTAHSELLARTSPTIYDLLIALFGGFAGIIAISSKQKGNVIPGVAIATALMPPLCTAGYGLATGQFYYFFGAFYLFTINSVFIAIASMIVSQILKFPIRTIVDRAQRKKVNQLISLVILITALPSIYFGYLLVVKEKFKENAAKYVSSVSIYEGNFLLNHEIVADKKSIKLIYGGNTLTQDQKDAILDNAALFNLADANIEIKQGIALDNMNADLKRDSQLNEEILRLKSELAMKDEQLSKLLKAEELSSAIFKEIKVLFPQITGFAVFNTAWYQEDGDDQYYFANLKVNRELKIDEKVKIEKWLEARLGHQNIKIFSSVE